MAGLMDRKFFLLNTNQVIKWLNPWPIRLPKGKWKVYLSTPSELNKFKCIWKLGKSKQRFSMRKVCSLLDEKEDVLNGARHYIFAMEKYANQLHLNPIIIMKKTVIDGNHTLLALLHKKYKKPILAIEYVRR